MESPQHKVAAAESGDSWQAKAQLNEVAQFTKWIAFSLKWGNCR